MDAPLDLCHALLAVLSTAHARRAGRLRGGYGRRRRAVEAQLHLAGVEKKLA